jgi:large subunit ribosomal protein L6
VSRVGNNPIITPSGVTINYSNNNVEVSGPKGKSSLQLKPEITLEKKENSFLVNMSKEGDKKIEALRGLYRMLINNMVIGVTKGFTKKLEIVGTGYKANVDGKKVVLNLGYSYPYTYNIPDGIKITVE